MMRKIPTQARSRALVEALLDATARVLRSEGAGAVSTNRVAEVAGVSVGSLYQYFPGKDALLWAVLERREREQLAMLQETLQGHPGPLPELVRSLVAAVLQVHRSDPALTRELVELRRRLLALAPLPELDAAFSATIADALRAWRGALRPLDIELATFVIQRSVDTLAFESVVGRPELLADGRLEEEIAQLILRYLGAPADKRLRSADTVPVGGVGLGS